MLRTGDGESSRRATPQVRGSAPGAACIRTPPARALARCLPSSQEPLDRVHVLRCATARRRRRAAEHPEPGCCLPPDMPAVIVLRDELEIDGTHRAVWVFDL